MNTIKLTLTGSQLDIEYHGSGLIPTASLNLDGKHDLRKLLAEMAEWCSRRVASPQDPMMAQAKEPYGDALLSPEQRADIVAAGNRGMPNQTQKTRLSMEVEQKPGFGVGESARMSMEEIQVGSKWLYLLSTKPDTVIEVTSDEIITEGPQGTAEHYWLRDEFLRLHKPYEPTDAPELPDAVWNAAIDAHRDEHGEAAIARSLEGW